MLEGEGVGGEAVEPCGVVGDAGGVDFDDGEDEGDLIVADEIVEGGVAVSQPGLVHDADGREVDEAIGWARGEGDFLESDFLVIMLLAPTLDFFRPLIVIVEVGHPFLPRCQVFLGDDFCERFGHNRKFVRINVVAGGTDVEGVGDGDGAVEIAFDDGEVVGIDAGHIAGYVGCM